MRFKNSIGVWKIGETNSSNTSINDVRELAAEFIDLISDMAPALENEGDEPTDTQVEQLNKICQAIDYIEIAAFLAETAILKKDRK